MVFVEPHTHPLPKTIKRSEVSVWSLRLWERMRDVNGNEEAWAILEEAYESAKADVLHEHGAGGLCENVESPASEAEKVDSNDLGGHPV